VTSAKIKSLRSLRTQMKAIARGKRPAPVDAARSSFNSVAALVRLLTPDNRQLLALIRDRKPRSVAELVEMTGRAQPNLTRTLAKLEAAGFITMKAVGRRKAPSAAIKKIVVEIDRWSQAVDATLYLGGPRWGGWRWTEDTFEVSMRRRKRNCGTAGSEGSR
jgi:predicted transcriptional regulator